MRSFIGKISLCLLLFLTLWQMTTSAFEHVEGIDLKLQADELAYTFFSIPSGESTLIQNGIQQNILIDTGDKKSRQALHDRLKLYHVDTIDALVITNQNQEFVGNLDWVIANYSVNTIIVPSIIKEKLVSAYQLPRENVKGWGLGKQEDLVPGLVPEVLYIEEKDDQNIGTLVFSLTFADHRTLFSGVADEAVEKQLTTAFSLKSAVLKVADFGSEKGTSQLFLDEVDPHVAILFKKQATSASELVMERLQETWIDIYQTARLGNVTIRCNDSDYEIVTVRSGEEDITARGTNQ